MSPEPQIVVLAGGVSGEREVSLVSGAAVHAALARRMPARLVDVTARALPAGLDPARDLVLSTLHGHFGEDGGMQALLEAAGLPYAGCDAAASRLTFDKVATKERAAAAGVASPRGRSFVVGPGAAPPPAEELVAALGASLVVKPRADGSSVGLHFAEGGAALAAVLAGLGPGTWLAEERVAGREVTVGVLDGEPLEVVEIRPRSGCYDYASKYTAGATVYLCPAPVSAGERAAVRTAGAAACAACGVRDYARVDFILAPSGPRLLEINTLPGMTPTSLLPKSAAGAGLDFDALLDRMLAPARARRRRGAADQPGGTAP